MKVSVFGLGYVGSVSAAMLASDGHDVIGVDLNPEKVAAINAGTSPIVEPGLAEALQAVVGNGRLRATANTEEAVRNSDISLICVGTPSRRNGSLDLSYVERVATDIGSVLKDEDRYHVVVVRSTVLPGSTHGIVIPALERASGKKYGEDFGVSMNPEFLREGTAIKDFRRPPMTLIGHNHAADAAGTRLLYEALEAPVVNTTIQTAEMIKYTSNTWHALKVCFANEIGNLCKQLGVDSHAVMDIFCKDDQLNLSPYYLKPGFAFGGSCLPKDVRAIQYRAKEMDVELPVISAILPSNRLQIATAFEQVLETGKTNIGMLGFSFKAGTDDLRESPLVTLAEQLLGKGLKLRIYDRNVLLARLVGANKEYIDERIPHLSSLLCESIHDVVSNCDVIIIGNKSPEFSEALHHTKPHQIVLDLVRIPVENGPVAAEYRGICW